MKCSVADIVPITKNGNLANPHDPDIHEWVPGGKFIATMCVENAKTPRSRNVIVLLKDIHSGTLYRIFTLDYVKMMVACKDVSHSIVRGLWEFVHVGKAYAIRLVQQLR
jgi:hypothetical protein